MLVLFYMVMPTLTSGKQISEKEKVKIIETVCSLLESNYIDPDMGKTVSAQLSASHSQGEYREVSSAEEFAAQLDADLTEWSSDKHLGVIYDPEWVMQIREEGPEDAYLTEEMVNEERMGNFGFRRMEILDGNVGYLDLRIFFHPKYAGETAVAAMNYLSNCRAVIIDLRSNGGGWGDMVSLLCSYFLDNEECVHLNSVYSRPDDRYYQSWTLPYVPGRILADVPLYILTSRSTFSAAEEFCYNLKYLKRSTIVGERTRGGAHPISSQVLDDDLILIIPECASIHPVTQSNWEGVGVEPDVEVPADEAFNVAYSNIIRQLRDTVLDNREKAFYQWHLDGFSARLNPVVVEPYVMQSYAGKYSSLYIIYENGSLFYRRGDRMRYRMTPMSQTLFLVDDQSNIRIRFKKEKDIVSGIVALYSDGNSSEYKREVE
ncbi:MAG: S41 family peptidase [candidate division WOR-3 bacterium]|nr:S41 family peptidase [candidate division WOR-3 bacterium]